VDILSRVTHITQTIKITRRPGEEGDGDEEPEIIFSAIPEELELEEVLEDMEEHEADDGIVVVNNFHETLRRSENRLEYSVNMMQAQGSKLSYFLASGFLLVSRTVFTKT
jgi:hypothetical protein